MSILIENVSKNFGNFTALDHINLEIKTGSIVALVGGSGSGKSTLLRLIAGFDSPNTGKIWLKMVNSTFLSIQDRKIGFLFQNYALFPHLTVYENIAFGLHMQHTSANIISNQVTNLLHLIQLEEFADTYPNKLSGGQQQRVAFARTMATQPEFLLLDEPFSALDITMRKHLRNWLKQLHKQSTTTTLFITHDHREALDIANEVVLFKQGRVEQVGEPKQIYQYLSI